MAAEHARKTDPTLAVRYQRLRCATGRHHNSAVGTIATVLLTRIVACLRNNTPYQLRDLDGSPITGEQGRAIVAERYQIPDDICAARRTLVRTRTTQPRRDERAQKRVEARCGLDHRPVPQRPRSQHHPRPRRRPGCPSVIAFAPGPGGERIVNQCRDRTSTSLPPPCF